MTTTAPPPGPPSAPPPEEPIRLAAGDVARPKWSPYRITDGAPLYPLFVLFGLNAVEELDRVAFSVLTPEIRDYFNLSLSGVLTVVALSLPAAIILGIPIAYFADRQNRTKIATAGAAVWGCFSIATGLAANVVMLGAARAGSALGKAVNDPTHNSLIPDYYSVDIRAKVYAAHRSANSVGQFIGPISAGALALAFTWRVPFLVFAIPTFIFVLLATKLREPIRGAMERRAHGANDETANIEERAGDFDESWRTVFAVQSLRRIYFSLPFITIVAAGTTALFSLFYEEIFDLNELQRGFIFAFEEPFQILGFIVGVPIAQRLMKRDPALVMKFLFSVCVAITVMIIVQAMAPNLPLAIVSGWLRAIVAAALIPGIYAILSLTIPPKARALGFTAGGLFVLLGLPILPIAGWLGDTYGIRWGIALVSPALVIGGYLLYTAKDFVNADISKVRTASVTQAEARAARMQGDPKILLIRDLDVSYGQTQVLFGVNMHVDEGEIVALLGTNGAGKSTLLSAISGLLEPGAGAIVYDGYDVTYSGPASTVRDGVVLVPGGKGVFPTLTVEENLALAGWLFRKDPAHVEAATEQVLEYFPVLRERWNQKAGNLSGGEQQMLTLGQAFIAQPKLLMIDELSLGLAPVVVEQLLGIVRDIHARGTSIILVEQSVNVAITLAQRAVFMEKGEVRFDGPTAQLLERPDILRAVFLEGTDAAQGNGGGKGGNGGGSPLTKVRERKKFDVHCEHCGTDHAIALETKEISVSFGGVRAVNGVDLAVHQGQILGIIGPNGAGKTTVFDLVSGFVTPNHGRVLLEGEDVTGLTPDARAVKGLGRSFQDARLFPAMTVRQTIATALERHIRTRDPVAAALASPATRASERQVQSEVDRLIELMNLQAFADKFVGELSTGSRRVVDLACSVAHGPKVLLLDEPSSGIAQRETEALGPLLLDIRDKTGAALVVIEHDMPLITAVSDELMALELGEVVAQGDPDDVINDPRVIEGYLGGDELVIQRSGSRDETLIKVGDDKGKAKAKAKAKAKPRAKTRTTTTAGNGGGRRRARPLQARRQS